MVPVPSGAEELVSKSQDEDVLDHLLAQVVVDAEDLILDPVRGKCPLEFTRTSKVFAERLLNLRLVNGFPWVLVETKLLTMTRAIPFLG